MKKNIMITSILLVAMLIVGSLVVKDNAAEDTLLRIQELKAAQSEKRLSNQEVNWLVSSKHATVQLPDNPNIHLDYDEQNLKDIYLAGGCFWGLEAYMSRVYGVYDVTSGYANGSTDNPTYEDVLYNNSGHAETVHVRYDPALVNVETLMAYYLKVVDPTSLNKQGNDRGSQYRTGVYADDPKVLEVVQLALNEEQMHYEDPIVVEVEALDQYTLAETYHQDYLEKNPNGYCHIDLKDVEEDLSMYQKPSDAVLKKTLSDLQYKVTQKDGTERSFDNAYWDNYDQGIYVDIVTGQPLFSSVDKYKSGTGWPSFTRPIADSLVVELLDKRLGFDRVEVRSRLGDSHLGHIFTDGPKDAGGLRYCLNSAALKFIAREDLEAMGFGYLDYLFE